MAGYGHLTLKTVANEFLIKIYLSKYFCNVFLNSQDAVMHAHPLVVVCQSIENAITTEEQTRATASNGIFFIREVLSCKMQKLISPM